ncbi:intermembrane lipid transfer protein VPS13D-like [Uloborus diversus]|uniref:intermembrane lipid transfer protein VPS13D-like n=1 Tax=Uloborus diversus TaxID=327109 RepID=UPI002409F6A8|nr:intermembrane lipid transfer protein VPS13D-like [Uloborus diversus]
MLEGLAAWILNTYVGEYVENLNTDQLSIGLLQGEVELENLPLKKDALKSLELPVEVVAGFIGKVKLQIPVSRLRSEPWVIFIERLFLIAGPKISCEYNEEEEQKAALEKKLAYLQALEAKSNVFLFIRETCYTNWMTYGTSLMANVIENVQLKVKDVHIRYEDEVSCSDHKFACGIVIRSLSAQSTDSSWAPKFVRRDNSDFMWKLLQLQGLSLYWDTEADILNGMEPKDMMAAMSKHLETHILLGHMKSHDYILSPVNAEAHLTRNCSLKPLRSKFSPRINCDIHLQKIPLSLSEVQYRQIMGCLKEFEMLDVRWKHRKWRPNTPVKNNAKKWWIYAISVHLEPIKQQSKCSTWSFAYERAQDIVQYSTLYEDYLQKNGFLSMESLAQKKSLEEKLSFELLCLLRDLVMKKIQRENNSELNHQGSKGKGFLQWMFPSWGGWYSETPGIESTEGANETDSGDAGSKSNVDQLKSHLEEEILDVLDNADNDSLLKRDTVFAQLNFSLNQGSFILLQSESNSSPKHEKSKAKTKSIIELEFSDVSTKIETRPRTGSFLFEIKLGALYLHDKFFEDSHFPHILAPQNRDVSYLYTKTSGVTIFPLPSFLNQKSEEEDVSNHLFEMVYEKKPFGIHADHKLNITTRALDVVYNPQLLKCVTDFFSLHHGKCAADFSVSELKLTAAARARYEVLKQQTKAELQHKWDQILDGEDKTVYSKGWNVELAISAPQIIVPEDILDKNSSVVVLDLGKVHFFNSRKDEFSRSGSVSEDLDDDEDFITPCSTPQELLEQIEQNNKLMEMISKPNDPQILKEHIYERYTLELSNIQVLVSRLKDNWKFAQMRGTSTMHILDRFSITVQTERRMVYTQDPDWPCIAITGNLPKLIVHISEQKVNALQTCVDVFNSPILSSSNEQMSAFSSNKGSDEFCDHSNEKLIKGKSFSKQMSDPNEESNESSLLLLMEFCVDQLSFDVQSRGRSVAELQVTGVKTTYAKHPHSTSLTLCVHSLLLVDALQTYGSDFELLLASHKHLSMDSTSGSLRDSDPNSPASPASPNPVSSPLMVSSIPSPPSILSAALTTLQNSAKKVNTSTKWSSSLHVPKTDHFVSDALIIIEFNWIECPSSEQGFTEVLRIANVQFNNLDVIANQETIVELVDFVKRIAIQRNKTMNGKVSSPDNSNQFITKQAICRTEITFDFYRLNILLLRALSQKDGLVGRKVATATITGARIQATVGKIIEIQGVLGGLQVLDLITENTKHQKIISIGYDPLTEHHLDLLSHLQEEMYRPLTYSLISEPQYALTFIVTRGDKFELASPNPQSLQRTVSSSSSLFKQQGYLNINIRMASLCYTHSPRLLYELSSCATEFKAYMSSLANSIKSACTEVAIGIVSKRTGSISATLHGNQQDIRLLSESVDELAEDQVFSLDAADDVSLDMKLDVLLQTPVVAFPSSSQSSDVLVAHLGRITIKNGVSGFLNQSKFSADLDNYDKNNTLLIEIRDMNMHFVNIERKAKTFSNASKLDNIALPNLSIKDLYACEDKSQLIIHDTIIEVVAISRKNEIASEVTYLITEESTGIHYEQKNSGYNQVEIKGCVVNPLKVVLSKLQFQQMLKVLDNLTYLTDLPTSDKTVFSSSKGRLESIDEAPTYSEITTSAPNAYALNNSFKISFELPELITELRGDLTAREEGIVSLIFQQFILEYRMEEAFEATLQVTLQTLLMEDLRNTTDTNHCYLMSSVNQNKPIAYTRPPKSDYISTSCPSLTETNSKFYETISMSLPDKLCTQNMFCLQKSRKISGSYGYQKMKSKSEESYPNTPPPSPTVPKEFHPQLSGDALVYMNMKFIDKKSPDFDKKYKRKSRFVDVDFNCLDIMLNLHTWVMLLDFFGLDNDETHSDTHKNSSFRNDSKVEKKIVPEAKETNNSEFLLKVKSLTVVLNKQDYKLASANISNFMCDTSIQDHTYTIKGTLGSISLSDLSRHGHLYPEKFITTGSEALHFHIFKYSRQCSDINTDFDLSVKCQMSSVQYVHTQRFLSEITAFFRHFNEMQELIRKIRLAASGAIIDNEITRGSRISLNISADSPVIVIPQSSSNTHVLVADLGQITVRNAFLMSGTKGTISYCKQYMDSHSANYSEFPFDIGLLESKFEKFERDKRILQKAEITSEDFSCLLDVINVELADMDLYSAVRADRSKSKKGDVENQASEDKKLFFPSFTIQKQGNDLLQQKFMLQLQIERNLDSAVNHFVPDWAVEGVVSSVFVTLDKKQYKLVYGILNQNLGEPLEEFTFDLCNESDTFVIVSTDDKPWTTLAIHMDLVNVSLEVIRDGIANKQCECSLAKFDFIKSRLCYESFSDNSKDIDLVSNMVQVSDIRFKDAPVNNRPNVFTKILQPTKNKENVGSTLQAEIHYRVARDLTRFTVLLNNMRIMSVFDFLQSVLDFLKVSDLDPGESSINLPKKISTISTPTVKTPAKTQNNFELKINVTDTELVVLEDTSLWDSNAVIVKATAVITWKEFCIDKPLSCNLQSLEVFSCILGVEEDTALSIIDPLTVSIEVVNKPVSDFVQHVLEVSAMNLNLRLSYYDMTMFLKIIESIKRQTAFNESSVTLSKSNCIENKSNSSDIDKLVTLGFSSADCERALNSCRGNINDSALWLTQYATPQTDIFLPGLEVESSSESEESFKFVKLNSAEIRISSCCLCIIDDCRDADVPVVEMTLSDVVFTQKLVSSLEGNGNFHFSADYYNRALSGWEPVIEPWKCNINWKILPIQSKPGRKLHCNISSDDAINFNVTSALIELCKTVKTNWTEDYLNMCSKNKNSTVTEIHSPGCYRRRLPFVPFALKNDTGCKLWFATQITSADQQSLNLETQSMPAQNSKYALQWTEVPAGNLIPVPFETRTKIRHKDSHAMKIHQIIVRVDGWLPAAPVSVDRVGTYFRHANPQISHSASVYTERPTARIVCVVSLEGTAKKLITVQSALLACNKLDEDAIELKLENSGMQYGIRSLSLYLVPHQILPIPLSFVHAQIWARPVDRQVAFCDHSIAWQHITKPEEIKGSIKLCSSVQKTKEYYRYLVCVKRRKFPAEKESNLSTSLPTVVQPAHKITFLPCLEIVNLLPYELHYTVKNLNVSGYIKPGKGKPLHNVDVSQQFILKFFLENFKHCKDISLSATSRHFPSRIELYDNRDRLLVLQLKIRMLPGGALKLFVTAPFWLVNKTGLPLIFKQEGTGIEAAGQFEEHELARCMAPLLFSFADRDASSLCNMRVGRSLHLDGVPQWSTRFDMEEGIRVRRLHVARKDSRPDLVYNIGINVRVGRGRYRNTYIVTLSPRYQLDNRTSHKLEFCQYFATKDNRQFLLSAMPKSSLPFHWPRIDLDNLLCVRQPDIDDCNWSGGFSIDNIKSFHINMRDGFGKSNFLRVEIVSQNATFFIVFTDADRLPPPFRIDNLSEVPITYYQTNVEQERLKTTIKPNTSVPYAFDEPTLPPYITCCAPGGSAATYNMNIFSEGNQLFYENFIYIIFTGTFESNDFLTEPTHNLSKKEYVLDVPFGSKVVINKREAGKRSQLWRMTSTGMLQHEGSSPPRDPHKPNASNESKMLVLDIAALGAQPGEFIPLMLRKPDPRRQHTQTWKFTADGRLCCGYPNLYVQAKDGFKGLRRGNDVVLGPSLPVSFFTLKNGIPLEQAISRMKLRGGSGVLTVKVVPDGPTCVLQISDIQKQTMTVRSSPATDWVVVEEQKSKTNHNFQQNLDSSNHDSSAANNNIEVVINLKFSRGLGLSLVNHLSEELIYVWLHNITVEYTRASSLHTLCGSIKDIQIDNQLRGAEKPVVLYITPSGKSDDQRHLPALHFTVQRMSTPLINAEIFKHFIVTIKNLTILLEERLLLKLYQFAGVYLTESEVEKMDESENNQSQKSLTETMAYEKRYYFSTLKLCLEQIKLSVLTSVNLQPDLLQLKRKKGLRLIRFEDATIELDSYVRVYPFETAEFLIHNIVDHYKEELKSQAAKILGAVDFLGNPLGLMNDVSDGISKLIHEGNVGGLIKNVTHGLSDSAAKISGTLSDGLGMVAMDDKHQKMRKQIRQQSTAAGNDHLMTGLKGLGFGILGGVTSVFTQTYEGAVQEGVQGFFSGLGKGIVGTVAKPAVGFLDFASGAASAVRDTSKGNSDTVICRIRPPRICVGPGGLLPRYSFQQGLGQEFLYTLNNQDYTELFIAKEQIRSGSEDLHALISSEQIYFLSSGSPPSSNVVLTVPFADLYKCCYTFSEAGVVGDVRHYLQLVMKADNSPGSVIVPNEQGRRHSRTLSTEAVYKKPQVRCDSDDVARKVAMQINYAKSLHEERTYMVMNDDESDEEKE